ncbi:MAG: DUF4185 domain-containing protein [Ilumatobacter sp.]|uniref:DUF4185 domain-containing protein n=1 Tax=Ilumatobacter sp. TaxID=1967498 RepID=UPI0032975151
MQLGNTRLINTCRVVAGVAALSLTIYWAGVTVPALASPKPASDSKAMAAHPFVNDIGLVETALGCARSLSSSDLHMFFGERRGSLIGWDNPHVIQLGPERWLWLNHDTYIDLSGDARTLHDGGEQNQNVAFEQTGNCFAMLHRGTPTERLNFEIGDGHVDRNRFLWPLGGEVDGDVVRVFWAETIPSVPRPGPGDGIIRHPTKTWLAEYDVTTLERLSFAPAPNSGVDPIYGFAVASDDHHSYLFGNTNMLNLAREGGFFNGPHSATKMYLARVPRGQLDQAPEYWNGTGWADDASSSVPISNRFFAENTMQPRYLDGRWVSVVQQDGFYSREVLLDVAEHPWGPWTTVDQRTYTGRLAAVEKNSYQPIILPWSSPEAGITIAISENATDWMNAVADPPLYRPGVFAFPWPVDLGEITTHAAASVPARRVGGSR